jgi:hypothetical protein
MALKVAPQLLDFLEAALDLRPTELDGLGPHYDPSALLDAALWLQNGGDPRADDLRQLGSARYFQPAGDPAPEPRPIACGRWWCIELRHPRPGCYSVAWRVYPGTKPYRRLEALYRAEARRAEPGADLSDATRAILNAGIPHPPGGEWTYSDTKMLSHAFESFRFALAAGLLGTTWRYVECRARLLRGDDDDASGCLAVDDPPPELVRQLRRRDPQRFRRLRSMADAWKARHDKECQELLQMDLGDRDRPFPPPANGE